METVEALIISRAVERTLFMLCAPLLLYLGFRLFVRALDANSQARAEMRNKYEFQAASFLPGSACILLAIAIGFTVFSQASRLSKAEEDLLIKLGQIAHPIPQNQTPVAPPAGPAGTIAGGNTKPPITHS